MKEALKAARDLISDPAHWTKGCYARDATGEQTLTLDPTAVSWCLMGALYRVSRDPPVSILEDKLQSSIGYFNDTNTHADVLAFLDEVINECP